MKLFCKKFKEDHIKGKAHDRKGLGMELALLVLLVTFACSTLLVSSALLGKDTLNAKEEAVLERIALDEFAERVLAADPEVAVTAPDGSRLDGFAYDWSDDGTTLTVMRESALAEPILTVRRDGQTITEWIYH